jgi:hypothetical protein
MSHLHGDDDGAFLGSTVYYSRAVDHAYFDLAKSPWTNLIGSKVYPLPTPCIVTGQKPT